MTTIKPGLNPNNIHEANIFITLPSGKGNAVSSSLLISLSLGGIAGGGPRFESVLEGFESIASDSSCRPEWNNSFYNKVRTAKDQSLRQAHA